MLARLAALMSGLALFACSTVGVRDTPQPAYTVTTRLGEVEIRQYGARVAAETVVAGDELDARSTGFRRLAGYIFGRNHGGTQIATAAPELAQQSGDAGTKIAMTAPVAQVHEAAGWRIRFFMPAEYSLQTLPRPDDPAVRLVGVPPETMAVLRFSGSPTSQAVAEHTSSLIAALERTAWRPTGAPVAWFYDPPWTLPPLRRNEVAIPVSPN
jgi:hypothetical protein